MVPLPPGNYSQMLTLRRLVTTFRSELSEPWAYLDEAYKSVGEDLPEPEGVRGVMSLNARLLASAPFQRGFVEAVERARQSNLTLPSKFCGPPLGADDIAQDITAYLGI